MYFVKTFIDTYRDMPVVDAGDNSDYEMNRKWKHLRVMGEDLANGRKSKLAALAHINKNHWVSVIVNFRDMEIMVGDLIYDTPDSHLMATFDWWI